MKEIQLAEVAIRCAFEGLFAGFNQKKPVWDRSNGEYRSRAHREAYTFFKQGVRTAEALHEEVQGVPEMLNVCFEPMPPKNEPEGLTGRGME